MANSISDSAVFESPIKHENLFSRKDESNSHLMPTNKDFQEAAKTTKMAAATGCDLPDFTIAGHGSEHEYIATPKRERNYELAREAMNGPSQADSKPASEQEKETARQVAEINLQAQADLGKQDGGLSHNADRINLHAIFQNLDPQSAQRVIAEANKTLESHNMRLAQSASGEVWSGSREASDKPFYLNTLLKEVSCTPSK
jgi:hypothetical protein